VLAAYGAPDWPSFACNSGSFPSQRMAEIVAYNSAHPTANFDGVTLDVEPNAQNAADFQALLSHYACMRGALPNDVQLAVAIRFYWDSVIEYPAGSGVSKPVYAHVIDMNMHNVIVMGYRDFSGPDDCSSDGIVCLDQDEIAYAASVGKAHLVLAGLETSDPASTGITSKETFFEEGASAMNAQAKQVIEHFGNANGLGGFAVHNYANSYLAGTTPWPARNPFFPTNVIALASVTRVSPSAIRISGIGVPNHSHTVATANVPNTSSFSFFGNVTANPAGTLQVDDPSVSMTKSRFYRLTFP
jgi:hypothetical protein